jgi:ribosomal protein S18 acetylase RimI-like enzyme
MRGSKVSLLGGFFGSQEDSKPVTAPYIRWLVARDHQEVLRIETAVQDFPLSEDEFKACLRQKNVLGIVVVDPDDRIAGYAVYYLGKHEIEVMLFAVRKDRQRQGIGKMLFDRLSAKLNKLSRRKMRVMVRDTELHVQLFLRAMGLKATSIHREAFQDKRDGYLFTKTLEKESESDE